MIMALPNTWQVFLILISLLLKADCKVIETLSTSTPALKTTTTSATSQPQTTTTAPSTTTTTAKP